MRAWQAQAYLSGPKGNAALLLAGDKKVVFSTLAGRKAKSSALIYSTLGSFEFLISYHKPVVFFWFMAGTTGLEPATSPVTVKGNA
jgi:hypothetical protein